MAVPVIRTATRRDLPDGLRLWKALNENGHGFDARWKLSHDALSLMSRWAPDLWLQNDPFPHGWIAEHDGRVVGWLDGHPSAISPVLEQEPSATIGNLYVEPAHRRLGIGQALVEAFLAAARKAGYPHAEVGTLTLDARAVAFWQAMGFGDYRVTLRRDAP